MTPHLQVLSRLLQSFWHINNAIDVVSLFAPISLTEITSEGDRANESLATIPVQIHLFSFKDLEEKTAELELNLSKDTGDLVNARIQAFFVDTNERDKYWKAYIEPFLSLGFQRVDQPKYPGIPVREYRMHGLAIGVNFETKVPFISTYVTLEDLHWQKIIEPRHEDGRAKSCGLAKSIFTTAEVAFTFSGIVFARHLCLPFGGR